ncbi:MAG TPA: O-antigen polymerase [Paludibacteraceae bacterium]|nr:O-antigen polymerase [Paludibacteraceae bacterium]
MDHIKVLDNLYLVINICLYLIAIIVCYRRYGYMNIGGACLVLYLSIAVVSLHLYNTSTFEFDFERLTLFPFLYLFGMLLMALSSLLKFDERAVTFEQPTAMRSFYALCVVGVLATLFYFISSLSSLQLNLASLFVDSGGADLYADSMEDSEDVGVGVDNLMSIISNLCSDVMILALFYVMTFKSPKKWLIVGIIVSVALSLIMSLSEGLRGQAVLSLLTILFTYYLFRYRLPQRAKRIAKIVMIVVGVLAIVPVAFITFSRFDNHQSMDVAESIEWYYGQSFLNFNNYGLDAGGIRYGDRTANFFKSFLFDDVPHNFVERREKYSHLKIDDYYFYTFVGDFTIDYGPILAVLLFIIFTVIFVKKTRADNNRLHFHQLLMLYFVLCVCVQGSFYLFSYSDVGGNLKMIFMLMLYVYFKLDYMRANGILKWK